MEQLPAELDAEITHTRALLSFGLGIRIREEAAWRAWRDAGDRLQGGQCSAGEEGAEGVIVKKLCLQILLFMRVARTDRQANGVGDVEDVVGEQRPVVAGLLIGVVDRGAVEGLAREAERRR